MLGPPRKRHRSGSMGLVYTPSFQKLDGSVVNHLTQMLEVPGSIPRIDTSLVGFIHSIGFDRNATAISGLHLLGKCLSHHLFAPCTAFM